MQVEQRNEGSTERKGVGKTVKGNTSLKSLSGLLFCSFVLVFLCAAQLEQEASKTYRAAYDAGHTDGQNAGKQDAEQNHLFDLANKRLFQRADRGFDPSRHEHEVYLVAYRRGFEDGYEQGYGFVAKEVDYGAASPAATARSPSASETMDLPTGSSSEIQIPVNTEIEVRLLDALSTQRNVRGDRFRAEVAEDVRIDKNTGIPRGTLVLGTIAYLKRAGRIAGRAEMNLRFEKLQFRDGTILPIDATLVGIEERAREKVKDSEGTIESEGSKKRDTKRVGFSSAIGALIGLISGGKKGAVVGAATAAAVGVAGVLATRGSEIQLYPGTKLVLKLNEEAGITPRPRK